MSTAQLSAICAAVKAAIAIDHRAAATPGVNDLSGPGQVRRGVFTAPWLPSQPCVAVQRGQLLRESSNDRLGPVPMGLVGHELPITLRAWTAACVDSEEARDDAASELADDLTRAIEEDPTLGGLVIDTRIDLADEARGVAQTDGAGSRGSVTLTVSALWRARAGV